MVVSVDAVWAGSGAAGVLGDDVSAELRTPPGVPTTAAGVSAAVVNVSRAVSLIAAMGAAEHDASRTAASSEAVRQCVRIQPPVQTVHWAGIRDYRFRPAESCTLPSVSIDQKRCTPIDSTNCRSLLATMRAPR